MPGSPKKRAMILELERRTLLEFPDEPEATILDYVVRWQSNGKTLSKLCLELEVSWELLKDTLNRKWGRDEVNARLSRAREDAAHRLADETLDIADAATDDNVQAARLQVSTRQWVAERWNRELAPNKQAGIQINIGTLMLEALRQPPPPVPAIAAAIVEEAQLLSADNAETCEVEQ